MMMSMRDAFGEAILKLGKINPKVVVLTADLGQSVRLGGFAENFPERYFNVGVSEADMIGVAAGLALEGFIPFCVSFATFLPGRCFDQIRVSVCQNKANVKLVGSHYGFTNPGDGASAQSIEDIALMRTLPDMTIISPCDNEETKQAVMAMAETDKPVYLRISRSETPTVTGECKFEIGKAQVLKQGKKVTIIACGTMVGIALQAASEINGEVINLSTIKPIDKETVLKSAKKTGRVITIEEHSVNGGMGSAIADFLSQTYPVPIKMIGIPDCFGESARDYQQLLDKYGLTVQNIIKNYNNF